MSVELEMNGYCNGCHHADVKVEDWFSDFSGSGKPVVYCDHDEVCEMWFERIPEKKDGITDGETEFITGNETFKKAFAAGWNACVKEIKKWEET